MFQLLLLIFIFTFEIVNCRIQLFTSSLLPLEYPVHVFDYQLFSLSLFYVPIHIPFLVLSAVIVALSTNIDIMVY